SSAAVLIAAAGMTLVILTRHIDISVGAQFSICGVVAGLLAQQHVSLSGIVLGTVMAGGAMGAINGTLVALMHLPSIVVTLATLAIFRETLRWWREGEFVRNLPPTFQWFGVGQTVGPWVVVGMALIVFLALAWAMTHLAMGRAVYAAGS